MDDRDLGKIVEAAGLRALDQARVNLGEHIKRFKPEDLALLQRVTVRATRQAAADAFAGKRDDAAWLQIDAQLKACEVAVAIPVKGMVRKTVLEAIGIVLEEAFDFVEPLIFGLVKKATGG